MATTEFSDSVEIRYYPTLGRLPATWRVEGSTLYKNGRPRVDLSSIRYCEWTSYNWRGGKRTRRLVLKSDRGNAKTWVDPSSSQKQVDKYQVLAQGLMSGVATYSPQAKVNTGGSPNAVPMLFAGLIAMVLVSIYLAVSNTLPVLFVLIFWGFALPYFGGTAYGVRKKLVPNEIPIQDAVQMMFEEPQPE